jgi:hypothetical protein
MHPEVASNITNPTVRFAEHTPKHQTRYASNDLDMRQEWMMSIRFTGYGRGGWQNFCLLLDRKRIGIVSHFANVCSHKERLIRMALDTRRTRAGGREVVVWKTSVVEKIEIPTKAEYRRESE